MSHKLYFVDSVYTPSGGQRTQVTLLGTEDQSLPLVLSLGQNQLRMSNHRGAIKEGWYVYYDESNHQLPFGYGNFDPFAQKQFRVFNDLRDELVDRFKDSIDRDDTYLLLQFAESETARVYSYHVNVGHGNCSLILIQEGRSYYLWMIDCSLRDCKKHYRSNLEACLQDIAKKVGEKDFKTLRINKFFLTHPHYDHYNGMDYLLANRYIDGNTECYINLFYQIASPLYNRIIGQLKATNVRFVEPINKKSIQTIMFLHPECRIYRSASTVSDKSVKYRIVSAPLNNSSVVIRFQLGGKTMVFPGDLEKTGFDNMTKAATCSPYLCGVNYYVVSHHASINGHPTQRCLNPRRPNPSPIHCISACLNKAIVMGRNGAFPGIYSPIVINYFDSLPADLLFSEKDGNGNPIKFYELEWKSGMVKCFH